MIRFIAQRVCAFDAEWVPDTRAGARLYGMMDKTAGEIRQAMWQAAGATPENPRPYLKVALSQIVSIAFIDRVVTADGVRLTLVSSANPEPILVGRFLRWLDRYRPQLVGFNSKSADMPAISQRAAAHGLTAPLFYNINDRSRDYFYKYSDWHVDLRDIWGGWGKSTPAMDELCAAFDIPGKEDVHGGDVLDLMEAGEVARVIQYNEEDALRTYMIWLRAVALCGLLTPEQRHEEELRLVGLLLAEISGQRPYLESFLRRWRWTDPTKNEPQPDTVSAGAVGRSGSTGEV